MTLEDPFSSYVQIFMPTLWTSLRGESSEYLLGENITHNNFNDSLMLAQRIDFQK